MTANAFPPVAAIPPSLRGAAGALGRRLRAVFRTLAYARMLGALHAMSDAQLARIGVARADIPAHALALTHGGNAASAANLR